MDYTKIYDRFIVDRLTKQPTDGTYHEKHHILPKALGGDDKQSNIIRLTPEDHFFAHLLLAKIHGGKMWCPLAFMLSSGGRKEYGWIKRALSVATSGTGSHQYDFTTHKLCHHDGRKWIGTQYEMASLGISRPLANMLVKGRVKSAVGWHLEHVSQYGKLGGKGHPMYRSESYQFEHVDGRSFCGSQYDFLIAHGDELSKASINNLVHRKAKCSNGWHLEGVEPATTGRGARWLKQRPKAYPHPPHCSPE